MTVLLVCCLLGLGGSWDTTVNADSFLASERQPLPGQGQTALSWRIRLNATYAFTSFFQLETAYEVDHFYREGLSPFSPKVWLRVDDLPTTLQESGDQVLLQRLDRLRLSYERNGWRVDLGRQSIGHGNGRFFNPSDLFAPLSPFSLNSQYKAGVDGARVIRAFGQAEWEVLALVPEQGEGVYLTRFAAQASGVDFSLLAGQTYGETTLAWDVAGTWAGAALYGEGLWREGKDRTDPFRAMAGVSRRFGTETDLTLEVHHHNLDADNPLIWFLQPEVQHGELFLFAPNHFGIGVSHPLQPLLRLSLSLLGETEDGSMWQQAGLAWDVSERATLQAGLLHTAGGTATEFGFRSDAAFLELRLTFP